jgi:uncharacterized protein
MTALFLDTSFILALEISNDQNHSVARAHWEQLARTQLALVTTSYVFDEVVTYLSSRRHHAKAVQVGNRLLFSPSVSLVHIDEPLFFAGWEYLQKHKDKQYSLTDCISFVVMQQRSIRHALGFDSHFRQAGFEIVPEVTD